MGHRLRRADAFNPDALFANGEEGVPWADGVALLPLPDDEGLV